MTASNERVPGRHESTGKETQSADERFALNDRYFEFFGDGTNLAGVQCRCCMAARPPHRKEGRGTPYFDKSLRSIPFLASVTK
jgi:hypothetical protein